MVTRDNAEYLFVAENDEQLDEWVTKLGFHAQLPPSMQLMSYDNHKVSILPMKAQMDQRV